MTITSCAKYQYFTIDSHLPKKSNGVMAHEDDALIIQYSFTENGHLNVDIQNKQEHLIYIDWTRSSIIVDDTSIPFYSTKQQLKGRTETIDFFDTGIESTNFNGTITGSPNRSYIPPKARITKTFDRLPIQFMKLKGYYSYEKHTVGYNNFKRYSFSEQDSLGYFRSYLYVNNNEDDVQPDTYDHSFWISGINESLSKSPPSSLDQFRKVAATGAGSTMVGLGAGTLLVLAVATADEE